MLFIKNFLHHFNLLTNKSLAILNGLFYITCLLSLAIFLVNPDVATKFFTAAAMLSVFIITNNINALKHNKKLLLLPLAMLFFGLLQILWVEFFKHPDTLFSGAYRSYQNGGKTLIFSSMIITAIYCKKNISNNASRIIPGAVIAISLSLYAFGIYQLYINTHFQLTDYRVNLGFEHATGTAYALTFVALLASQAILNTGPRWAMLFYVLHFILSLAVIIATQTRSAILVYPVLCIILFFLHYRHHRHIAMATGTTFLAIIVLTCIPLKTMLESRFQDIRNDIVAYQTDNSQTSIGSRLAMQRAGYKAGINHLWGQSLEQRNTYIMRLANADHSLTGATEYLSFHLHNEFIDTFSLKGLPGVLLLLALYGSLLYTAFIIRCPLTLALSVAVMMFGLSDLLFYAKGEALSCMLTLCVGLILMLNAKKEG